MAADVEIHNLFMAHEKLLQDIVKHLSAEPGIEALFLAGSYGQSKADRFSDIDLLAIADEQHHERVSELWRATFERLHTVVFWNERRGRRILLNAISMSAPQPILLAGPAQP